MDNLAKLQARYGLGTTELKEAFKPLRGIKINFITAGIFVSGVSQIVGYLSEYFNELGLICKWENAEVSSEFAALSQKIANSIFSPLEEVPKQDLERFLNLSAELSFDRKCDILYINDHPAISAVLQKDDAKKVFRAHYDASLINKNVWDFFAPVFKKFDGVIFASPIFHRPLNAKISYITPTIDPLTIKNTFVEKDPSLEVLKKLGIPNNRPIVLQVSRFDRFKDLNGLIDAFEIVSKEIPSTLVIAGTKDTKDPQAKNIYAELKAKAKGKENIFVLALERDDYIVASLQSIADVVVQKSFSESFGMAVTEALWKAKAVVGSDTGGIPFQIKDRKTGLLCTDAPSTAEAILKLLKDKSLALRLGKNGRQFVQENFLITTELKKHLELFKKIL
ncbi:MAG: glycosyltransferase [Elusimicrobiota bacterium]|jgi:trehalose synthase|nr:glycosyltransferase [Elusimicrobiota bacterium]